MTEGRLALWLLILAVFAAFWVLRWRHYGGTTAPRWRSDVAAGALLGAILVSLFVLQVTGARELPWWFGVLTVAGIAVFAVALWAERGRPWS